jgi:hypothetical protein
VICEGKQHTRPCAKTSVCARRDRDGYTRRLAYASVRARERERRGTASSRRKSHTLHLRGNPQHCFTFTPRDAHTSAHSLMYGCTLSPLRYTHLYTFTHAWLHSCLLHALPAIPHSDDEVGLPLRAPHGEHKSIPIAIGRPRWIGVAVHHSRDSLHKGGVGMGSDHSEDRPG